MNNACLPTPARPTCSPYAPSTATKELLRLPRCRISPEAAARLRDRAHLAVHGRGVPPGALNFPLSDYPGEVQRYGQDLMQYIQQLA